MCRFKFCFTFSFLLLVHFYVDNCLACVSFLKAFSKFCFTYLHFFESFMLFRKMNRKEKKSFLKLRFENGCNPDNKTIFVHNSSDKHFCNNNIYSFEQNGYKMKLISVDNCDENNVVSIDKNFTANLSPDCILSTVGCLTSKGFKEAKVKSIISNIF